MDERDLHNLESVTLGVDCRAPSFIMVRVEPIKGAKYFRKRRRYRVPGATWTFETNKGWMRMYDGKLGLCLKPWKSTPGKMNDVPGWMYKPQCSPFFRFGPDDKRVARASDEYGKNDVLFLPAANMLDKNFVLLRRK